MGLLLGGERKFHKKWEEEKIKELIWISFSITKYKTTTYIGSMLGCAIAGGILKCGIGAVLGVATANKDNKTRWWRIN